MKKPFALFAAFLLSPPPVPAADQPSVLVTTVKALRGSEPDLVIAYGSATPLPGAATNLSLLHGGQVLQLGVTPGQSVRKGENLLRIAADPAAIRNWDQAVSALALARRERADTGSLLKQQLATRVQLAQADKAVQDAQAALDALRREGGNNRVETVAAPFDGIVTAISVNSGDRVPAGAPLMTLAPRDAVAVTAGIEPELRPRLRPGQKVRLLPLDGEEAVAGTVASVGAMLNARTRMIDIVITAAPGTILPGEGFQAAITVGRIEGWLVPRDAVLSDETGPHVFQVSDGRAVRVGVGIVGAHDDTTVVSGALQPERPLVTEGNYQLSDGMPVRENGGEPGGDRP